MLLVVSLGLSVVRESLGRTMRRCQVLAVAHFLFGGICACLLLHLRISSRMSSPLRRRHRGARVRVNFCIRALTLCGTTGFHLERFPVVDSVCVEWYVPITPNFTIISSC
jgi:hypothetical protein